MARRATLGSALTDPRTRRAHAAVERALAEMERLAGPADEHPERVNHVLASLATDLESTDAPQLVRLGLGRP